MPILDNLKKRVSRIKGEVLALSLAARHPETPWYAKLFVVAVVAYALSPIDLIPDFVPVLGYLDDLILIPLGISVAIKMIPSRVLNECRAKALEAKTHGKRESRIAAMVIIGIWLVLATLLTLWAYATYANTHANGYGSHAST